MCVCDARGHRLRDLRRRTRERKKGESSRIACLPGRSQARGFIYDTSTLRASRERERERARARVCTGSRGDVW